MRYSSVIVLKHSKLNEVAGGPSILPVAIQKAWALGIRLLSVRS